MTREPYAIVAVIQQEVGKRLEEVVAAQARSAGRLAGDAQPNLLEQLRGSGIVPKGVDLGFLQEVGGFIAASAGTFAGTAVRKATQHVFLSELEHLRLQH